MKFDDDTERLILVVGEECAISVMALCTMWRHALERPELTEILAARSRASLNADLRNIAKGATALADLLYPHDAAFWLASAAAKSGDVKRQAKPLAKTRALAEAGRRMHRLSSELRMLTEWATEASKATTPRRGPPVDQKRARLLGDIAQRLAWYGLPLSTGENSKLVRVARIAFGRMGMDAEARDPLRRLVAAGTLDLEHIATVARQAMRGLSPAEILERDPIVQAAALGIGGGAMGAMPSQ